MVSSNDDLILDASKRNNSNIKCNLDMKVVISNVEKGGTQQEKSFIIKLYILMFVTIICSFIFTTIMYIDVKKIQLQMDKLNNNIVQLRCQYVKMNRNMNRKYLHKRMYPYGFIKFSNVKSSDRKLSNLSEVNRKNDNNKSDIYSNQTISPMWNRLIDHQDVVIEINSSTNLGHIITSSIKSVNNSIVNLNEIRYFSRNLKDSQTSEIQNLEIKNKTDTDVLNSQNELQITRLRRSIERAKKGQQKRKRSRHRKSDPLVTTFIGAIPEQHTNTHTVRIGPWKKNNRSSNLFDFTKFHLADHNMSIEVAINGLYMISVQIFYYGESKKYSYYIMLNSENANNSKKLVTCVTAACNVTGEITCYTSIVVYMRKGDRLSVEQKEKNRFINLREGYSYIQLVMLAKDNRNIT